jgi:hypothetical protein
MACYRDTFTFYTLRLRHTSQVISHTHTHTRKEAIISSTRHFIDTLNAEGINSPYAARIVARLNDRAIVGPLPIRNSSFLHNVTPFLRPFQAPTQWVPVGYFDESKMIRV